MLRNTLIIIALCAGLLACQHSPRKHYFILSATAAAQTSAAISPGKISKTVIGIGPVEIADYLDRSYIGYAENDNTLTIAENDYWAEPLDKGIARVIALNLSQLNSAQDFISFPWRSDSKPQYSLRIQLHSLTRNNTEASISATWELIDNGSKRNLKRKNFSHSIAAQPGTKALVQSYSKLLAALAEEMNQSLAELN